MSRYAHPKALSVVVDGRIDGYAVVERYVLHSGTLRWGLKWCGPGSESRAWSVQRLGCRDVDSGLPSSTLAIRWDAVLVGFHAVWVRRIFVGRRSQNLWSATRAMHHHNAYSMSRPRPDCQFSSDTESCRYLRAICYFRYFTLNDETLARKQLVL